MNGLIISGIFVVALLIIAAIALRYASAGARKKDIDYVKNKLRVRERTLNEIEGLAYNYREQLDLVGQNLIDQIRVKMTESAQQIDKIEENHK